MPDTEPQVSEDGQIWRCEISRHFQAPLSQVWRAFADPVRLAGWFGPEGLRTELQSFDFCTGGDYALTMHHEDGREFPLRGRFVEIVEGERIVMTWLWLMPDATGIETLVTFSFAADGDGTRLDLSHERFGDADNAAGHGEGWTSTFNKFATWLVESDT